MSPLTPPRRARIAAPLVVLVGALALGTQALTAWLVGNTVEERIASQLADTARLVSGAHFPLSDATISHLARYIRAEVVVVLGTKIEATSLDEAAARRFEGALASGAFGASTEDVTVKSAPAGVADALVAAAPLPAKGDRARLFLIYPGELESAERSRAARPILAVSILAVALAALLGTLLERAQTRERTAELARLVSALAHEVKNPLGAIKLTVETLRDSTREPRDREALELVASEADRLALLVDELRLLGGGHRPFRPEPVRPGEAVDAVLLLLRRTLEHRGLRVERDGAAGLADRPVLVDRRALQQALLNVLLNAVEASPPEGTIRVSVSPTERGVAIDVRDEGPGVPESIRARLFQPFVTTKEGGTGLGLALARLVAREHGGDLALVPGGPGTRFRLELPLAAEPSPKVLA
jgi:signal transduction histidine kinase